MENKADLLFTRKKESSDPPDSEHVDTRPTIPQYGKVLVKSKYHNMCF